MAKVVTPFGSSPTEDAVTVRWREDEDLAGRLYAHGMMLDASITSDSGDGHVWLRAPGRALTPDEARDLGMRMIEAAARAEGYRVVKHA